MKHVGAEQEALARSCSPTSSRGRQGRQGQRKIAADRPRPVVQQFRSTYDTLVRGLTGDQQEELWKGVVESLHDPIDSLAKAMGEPARPSRTCETCRPTSIAS